jgi:hypothetical protein
LSEKIKIITKNSKIQTEEEGSITIFKDWNQYDSKHMKKYERKSKKEETKLISNEEEGKKIPFSVDITNRKKDILLREHKTSKYISQVVSIIE